MLPLGKGREEEKERQTGQGNRCCDLSFSLKFHMDHDISTFLNFQTLGFFGVIHPVAFWGRIGLHVPFVFFATFSSAKDFASIPHGFLDVLWSLVPLPASPLSPETAPLISSFVSIAHISSF
jgi:hypothetical protein